MMNIGLCGLGKAGQEFVRYMQCKKDFEDFCLTDVLCRDSSPTAGKSVKEVTGIYLPQDILIKKMCDYDNTSNLSVLIDFSASGTSKKLVDLCCKNKINLVICTTDFSPEELQAIKEKCEEAGTGIVYAPTLTLGINMLIDFTSRLSQVFPGFSFSIVERHGRQKSSPTKTACIISENIKRGDTKISSVRLDGYVGVHEVSATDGLERITIEHESFSRSAFARGALFAANYIKGKKGFFYMHDIMRETLSLAQNTSLPHGGGYRSIASLCPARAKKNLCAEAAA